jgi:hypothetical protein
MLRHWMRRTIAMHHMPNRLRSAAVLGCICRRRMCVVTTAHMRFESIIRLPPCHRSSFSCARADTAHAVPPFSLRLSPCFDAPDPAFPGG